MSANLSYLGLQRSLAVVYRFYDIFFQPPDDLTPIIDLPLEVTIPSLNWQAFRALSDFTYRFSWPTLTQLAPTNFFSSPQPSSFVVEVVSPSGAYVSFEPLSAMEITLPLPVSVPPKPSDFLITKPLWPTPSFRPPVGETAVRGILRSSTAQPVTNLKVEIWLGSAATPPPGTPFTCSSENGEFLFRFPLLKGSPGDTLTAHIRLNDGTVVVKPATLPILIGCTQIIPFQRI